MTIVVALTLASFASANEVVPDQALGQLRHEYRTTTDYIERLIAASKLARAGDYTYWSFVRREAEKAVRHDRPRRRWFRFRPIEPVGQSMRYMSIPHLGRKPMVTGEIEVNAHEHRLDVWRILTFSSAAPPADQDLLREAVQSPRPEIAGYAALGLARLRDLQFADTIARAGHRAPESERALFIEALVYFNDEYATQLATQVAGENAAELLPALKVLAQQNHYDPFDQR